MCKVDVRVILILWSGSGGWMLYMRVSLHTHTHTHTHTHSRTQTRTHIHVQTRTYSHTHAHVHTLAHAHTHTHTHTFPFPLLSLHRVCFRIDHLHSSKMIFDLTLMNVHAREQLQKFTRVGEQMMYGSWFLQTKYAWEVSKITEIDTRCASN